MLFVRFIPLAMLWLTLTVTAQAHEQEQAKERDTTTPSVLVAGSYDARRDETAARTVLSREDMLRHGDASVLDALKRLPGVTVTGNAGRNPDIRLQGLGNGYTQLLIDGEAPSPGMAFDTLTPGAIERIEVMRVASAAMSSQAIAGTINVVLRKLPRKAEGEWTARYAGGAGTRNPGAELRLADGEGKFAYVLAGSIDQNTFQGDVPSREEAVDGAGTVILRRTTAARENGHINTLRLAPQLSWSLAGGDTLTLDSSLNLLRFAIDVGAPTTTAIGAPPRYPDLRFHMLNDNDAARSELHWVHAPAAGGQLDMKLAVSSSRTTNRTERSATGLAVRIDSPGRDQGVQSTGKFTVPVREGHALALGWDGALDHRTDAREEGALAQPATPDLVERYAGTVARLALYAQDEWNLAPRWSLYLGGRWEGVRLRAEGSDFGSTRSQTSVFSPVAQTLYKLANDKDQWRLAVSRTYKAPGLDKLLPHRITAVNNSQVEPDTAGNPGLQPELAWGIDGGWEHRWAEGALLSASASAREIDDLTRYLVQFDGVRWLSRPANIGKAHTRNVELEARFPVAAVLPGAPALELRASLARNWSRIDGVPGPDNRIEGQTPLSAALGADYKRGRFATGASFAYRKGSTVRLSTSEASYQAVQRDLELYANWKIDKAYELKFSALNVLGQDIVNERSYINTATNVLVRNRIVNVGYPSLRVALASRF